MSIVLHTGAIGLALGMAAWRGWSFIPPVEIEIVSTKVETVKELPLGPPPAPAASGGARVASVSRVPKSKVPGAMVTPVRDAGAPEAQKSKPGDLRSHGPEGSRLTAWLRLDRLRTGPSAPAYIAVVDELLRLLPDRRRLVEGTGLDLYRDFDALLVATPNPLDDAVTFLAVRHRLTDEDLKAALNRSAAAAGRPIVWRTEGGRPVGIRKSSHKHERDDRIFIFPKPGLAIMAPAAYAELLLGRSLKLVDDPTSAPSSAPPPNWGRIVARIDAEDGAVPEDAVLVMTATNLLKARGDSKEPSANGAAFGAGLRGGLPDLASLVVRTAPSPLIEVKADFAQESSARDWQIEWPGLKQQVLGNPLLLLGGLGGIVGRTELERDGKTVVLRTTAATDELLRILQTAVAFTRGRGF
jgi:hypothetical protein